MALRTPRIPIMQSIAELNFTKDIRQLGQQFDLPIEIYKSKGNDGNTLKLNDPLNKNAFFNNRIHWKFEK